MDPSLQSKLERLTHGFGGHVGIYVRHLRTGESAALRADEVFPTASLIKVPILVGVFRKLETGELQWRAPLVYDHSRAYRDEDDLLVKFTDGSTIDVGRLIWLMCSLSDNTASLWLQELCGTGAAINEWLAEHGFASTRVNSRTPGREAERKLHGWGQTTPREMAELVVRIREGRAISPAASERMHRVLCRSYWDGEALSAVPPGIEAASKQGAVNRSRSEVVLVHAPHADYVFCVITKNQQDQSWKRDNAGYELLRGVSRLLWEHFEPQQPWQPTPGVERYW